MTEKLLKTIKASMVIPQETEGWYDKKPCVLFFTDKRLLIMFFKKESYWIPVLVIFSLILSFLGLILMKTFLFLFGILTGITILALSVILSKLKERYLTRKAKNRINEILEFDSRNFEIKYGNIEKAKISRYPKFYRPSFFIPQFEEYISRVDITTTDKKIFTFMCNEKNSIRLIELLNEFIQDKVKIETIL